jgi:hypothetical protein
MVVTVSAHSTSDVDAVWSVVILGSRRTTIDVPRRAVLHARADTSPAALAAAYSTTSLPASSTNTVDG